MAKDAGRYEQPELCLPIVDGMALDQLLVKLRMAADNEFAFLVKDKTEQSLRKLDDASLWEVTQHMYANLDTLISMFRWRWREENHAYLERARSWHYRRSGWFILLAETKDASILVSPDWRCMFEARAPRASARTVPRVGWRERACVRAGVRRGGVAGRAAVRAAREG